MTGPILRVTFDRLGLSGTLHLMRFQNPLRLSLSKPARKPGEIAR